ncbi:hypothetical protein AVEN_100759-1 [Araneus ventricosus]|uniref:Uncharacterized protein n=1 Tax=Araneus ventricosus TaxID=182803 RepID=A0A4Y2U464_ARAVE|nr:hypothetical protein AVEN_100759-1 [Araneus ventricosus]
MYLGDHMGVAYYGLLQSNKSCQQQLMQLSQSKTARLDYVSKPLKETVEELNCYVLPLSPYSADVVLSDYHLFRLMSHCFSEQCIHSYEDMKKSQFVDSL